VNNPDYLKILHYATQLQERLQAAEEALRFILETLVPYSPESDEGYAIEKARAYFEKHGEKKE